MKSIRKQIIASSLALALAFSPNYVSADLGFNKSYQENNMVLVLSNSICGDIKSLNDIILPEIVYLPAIMDYPLEDTLKAQKMISGKTEEALSGQKDPDQIIYHIYDSLKNIGFQYPEKKQDIKCIGPAISDYPMIVDCDIYVSMMLGLLRENVPDLSAYGVLAPDVDGYHIALYYEQDGNAFVFETADGKSYPLDDYVDIYMEDYGLDEGYIKKNSLFSPLSDRTILSLRHFVIAGMLESGDSLMMANECIRQALEYDDDDILHDQMLYMAGRISLKIEDYEDAANYADMILAGNKADPDAYLLSYLAYFGMGDSSRANQDLMIHYQLIGNKFYHSKDYKTARLYYSKAIKQNLDGFMAADLHYCRGKADYSLFVEKDDHNALSRAFDDFNYALVIDPDNKEILQCLFDCASSLDVDVSVQFDEYYSIRLNPD